jgi:hypothetical protein
MFIQLSKQWKSVQFHLGDVQEQLLYLPENFAPILESADLELPEWPDAALDKVYRAFHSSSSLHHIGFGRYHKLSPVALANLMRVTLTRLQLGNLEMFTPEEFTEILRPCRELTELDVVIPWPEVGVRFIPVTLPKLRVCTIKAFKYNSATLLNRLNCPALHSLDLFHAHAMGTCQPPSCSYIEGFLRRSSCSLRAFFIHDPTGAITESDLLQFLQSPPLRSLENLYLNVGPVLDETVKFLTLGQANHGLLPRLSVLTLPWYKAAQGLLLDMVTSRLPTLKAISIMDRPPKWPAPPDFAHLEELRDSDHVLTR